MNECTACKRDFATVPIFDRHRVGAYPQTGPADWLDRIRAGLVDVTEEWKPTEKFGRRCLEDDELLSAGWTVDRYNRWVAPGEVRSDGRLENRVERVAL